MGDAAPKLLELLLAMMPKLSHVAVLANPVNPALATSGKNLQSAAHSVGASVLRVEVRTAQEIDNAFPAMVRGKAEAVIAPSDSLFINGRTAKALGLAIPQSVLLRADRVIL